MINKWKRIDWSIVIILLFFMGLSICLIHSGIAAWPKFKGSDTRMLFYYILGFFVFFGILLVDYRILIKYHMYIFAGGILLLVSVLFIGSEVNGAKGWIKIPGVGLNLQPAELFKLILILTLGALLAKKSKLGLSFWRDIVPLGLVTMIPFGMVMAQNDIGNALSYLVILLGMLWVGNIKYSHTLIILVIFTATFYGGVKAYINYHDDIATALEKSGKAHWLKRIDPWLMPETASSDASYHTRNAKLAIASGGMFGKGYMKGSMVQSALVPYTYSDSIIVVVGEEFGFIGVSVLILLYFILIYRLILIALECRDRAGPLIITGIVAMFLYQIFENIGMFIGLMPLTGITLPFISYGGTSLIINMVSLALVMSIRLYGQDVDDIPLPSANKKLDQTLLKSLMSRWSGQSEQ
ncbi:rod shape-determining protein RodA [Paenibacillus anaericanus]|uniref:Rod shape-determining protein RodA n=1 Tax=Paenibacillus anaericanus TaxID=170367 RepID=A0A3S1K1L1_9BACL|nr:FtsW/RodA/SpoVE family cell cycle protein [Paenibacillus anaericanus]RUT41766.1 rod shape-determining protein RodA [Paenibacillus anaericanus]